MKKTLLLLSMVFAAVLFSCGHFGATKTSLVTIAVGNDQVASIKAVPATFTNKAVAFFAKIFRDSGETAVAAIPSVVSDIRVTVSAPDIPTISTTVNVAGQSMVVLTLEVPNGLNRDFLIEGLDNMAAVTYWDEFLENLSGSELNKSVEMLFIGAAQSYLYVDIVNGNDTNPGTKASPYGTITKALAQARLINGNVAIFINPNPPAGPYSFKNGEAFPLALSGNTALVCLGSNFTTVIDNTPTFGGGTTTTISGAVGAVVNGCRINFAGSGTPPPAVSDNGAAMTIIGSLISGGTSTLLSASTCIALSANSRVAKSTITNCNFGGNGVGISIGGGSPTIELNTVAGNQGTGISVSAGNPTVQNNDIQTNTTGISWSNVGGTVTGNAIHNNATGMFVSGSTANPVVSNNSIYCNTSVDLNAAGTVSFNPTFNSWDHDSATIPPGPTVGIASCTGGVDICGLVAANFTPFNSAVSGGCL